MTALDVRTGYRLWAPTYSAENAISAIEDSLVRAMTPPLGDRSLLDAGCGTGRRLIDTEAARTVGVDLSPDMLAVARANCSTGIDLREGDVRALPVETAGYDVVWCRLVIGHLADAASAYRELARAAAPGAEVIVTDFHPDAQAAGHRRSFRAKGRVHELEHHARTINDHVSLARSAGLTVAEVRHGRIGSDARPFYESAGKTGLFAHHLGLAVVLAMRFRRA